MSAAAAFTGGLVLGLTLITPIGAQNAFVLNQGLLVGMPGVLVPAVTAAACDTALILLGGAGASLLLGSVPLLRGALLVTGVAFLAVLGVRGLRARPQPLGTGTRTTGAAAARYAAGVSLLNPHAILDTVGVIGGAVAAQPAASRLPFTAGTISASWLWFLLLGLGASLLHRRLTPAVRCWIERATGLAMLGIAVVLLTEL